MHNVLIPLYGPLAINSFGFMIVLGILTFTWLVAKDPRRASLLPGDALLDVIIVGTCVGVFGARILCIATDWHNVNHWTEIFKFWESGYSVLGALIALFFVLPHYLRMKSIPVLPCLDLFGLYAPLMQAIAKMGCFFAGCCYGKPTTLPWGITYTDAHSMAPTGIPLHPTQLYTVIILLGIFIFQYFYAQKRFKRPGQLFYAYLLLALTERLLLDFLRDDRVSGAWWHYPFSLYQCIAWVALVFVATFCYLNSKIQSPEQSHESV